MIVDIEHVYWISPSLSWLQLCVVSVLVIKDKAEDLITNLIILQTNTTMGRDSAANLQVFTEQMLLLLQFDQSERERVWIEFIKVLEIDI